MATVLLTAAFLATPNFKVANAQANETKALDVDGWIAKVKENHPALANIGEAGDVKDVIIKIKAMDGKEAVRTLLALHILNDLQELKAAEEAQ